MDNSDLFFGEKIPVLLDSQGECAEVSDELYVCWCGRAYFALEVRFFSSPPLERIEDVDVDVVFLFVG